MKNQQMMNMGHGTKDGNKRRGKLSFSTYLEHSVFSHFYTSNIFLKHLKTLIFIKKKTIMLNNGGQQTGSKKYLWDQQNPLLDVSKMGSVKLAGIWETPWRRKTYTNVGRDIQ